MFACVVVDLSAVILPFSTNLAIILANLLLAKSNCAWFVSHNTTLCPDWAATCAIPAPIEPAPNIPICIIF